MQTISSILKKVRALDIKSRKLATNLFTGEYHSAFRGQGMSFKEVREYTPGDDIRSIDWNTSARFGHPFSKVYEEERELTMMLLVDISASTMVGVNKQQKKELIAELAAILAFSAISNGDKVGAIFFSDRIEQVIPPQKTRDHFLYLVRKLVSLEPKGTGTDISKALQYANNTLKHRAICLVISDFDGAEYEKPLKVVGKRHDGIAIMVEDLVEQQLPTGGILQVIDPETGREIAMDTADINLRRFWTNAHDDRVGKVMGRLKKAGWDFLQFQTGADYIPELQNFFIRRIKR